jgi:hypothetical protein
VVAEEEDGYRWVEILHQSDLETGRGSKIGQYLPA